MNPALELLLMSALALSSDPYARTHVNATDPSSHCLWWKEGTVTFTQSDMGNPETRPAGAEFGAVTRAWQSWQAIHDECGNLTLREGPPVSGGQGSRARRIAYDPSASDNINLILFRQRICPTGDPCSSAGDCNNKYDCWSNNSGTIALTTTTFTVSTGQILDADVELNAASFHFTAVDGRTCVPPNLDSCVSTDIQNTMTHEFGHVHGLDHTSYVDRGTGKASIMNPNADRGEVSKRIIDPATKGFVCNDAYPKGRPSHDCVATQSSGCSSVAGLPLLPAAGWILCCLARRRGSRRARGG
jgi:hypothetical protein